MDWCMMKKVKGYLMWVLVFYTILVTYFLVLSAWSDDVGLEKRHGRDYKLINVLYQEERRHLRSFKDVIKTYGGLVSMKIRQKFKKDSNVNSGGDTSEGRLIQGQGQIKNTSKENGSLGMLDVADAGNVEIGGGAERPRFTVEVETWDEAMMGKSRVQSSVNDIDNGNNYNNNNDIAKNRVPDTGNIFIEEVVPETNFNTSGDKNTNVNSQQSSISNVKNQNYERGVSVNNQSVAAQNSKQLKSGVASPNKGSSKSNGRGSNRNYDADIVTEYCDKIDAEEPHLCLTERVTFSHPSHVNITTNRMSFKPLGDLYIYSGFLDTRNKPASIRFMIMAPKGRDSVKKSGYWCAFNLPTVMSQRYYWNGIKEPASIKPHQATQLDYYAASVGHDRTLQFYIMSCAVPEKHLSTLRQFDTSRLHLVAGGKDSPLLDTVQERISVDVLNNQGLPWHEMIKNSPVLGEVFQLNNSKNNTKTDTNSHYQHALSKTSVNHNIENKNYINTSNKSSLHNSSSRGNDNNINISNSTPSSSFNPNSIVSCIAPIASTSISVVQMAEFIELTLLLGSQHIVMYTLHLPDDVRDVLAMYRYKGLITILPWSIPNSKSIWANGRDIALNDCLYRTMYRYEFALFHDMDEFFVPRSTPDLPSFINFLYTKAGMKRNRTSDILFSSAYFSPPTKTQSQSLTTLSGYTKDIDKFSSLRSVHRTYFNPNHSLRMIRPVMAFRVGGGERKRTVFTISPRYAAVNHYSKCVGTSRNGSLPSVPLKNGVKSTGVDCNATKVDMRMWAVKERLIRQTKESIRDMNSKR